MLRLAARGARTTSGCGRCSRPHLGLGLGVGVGLGLGLGLGSRLGFGLGLGLGPRMSRTAWLPWSLKKRNLKPKVATVGSTRLKLPKVRLRRVSASLCGVCQSVCRVCQSVCRVC